jgi:hypothetical protein
MATFNKFEVFSEDLAKGVHNLHTHTIKAYLTDNAPSASADAVKADLVESVSGGNGYTAGGHDVQNTVSRSGATTSVLGVDITITASGGSIGPFRYVPFYNDDPTSPADPLIGWLDYGSSITILNGESFTIDVGAALGTIGA